MLNSFDPIWEDLYASGKHLNKYPFSSVVSFFYRYLPSHLPVADICCLEVGFGAANNLWFLAREGVQVSGVEGSKAAVDYSKQRFAQDNLVGDLREGDFTVLPFQDNSFHMALDRGALCHTGKSLAQKAVAEIWRTLKPGGHFYSEGYSDRSTARGKSGADGTLLCMTEGPITGIGQMAFYSRSQIEELFADGWSLERLEHVETIDMLKKPYEVLACWCVTARKKP